MNSVEIAGRYRLEGRLGFGGMSTVHRALDLRLERQVAVKLLAEHLADDPDFVSRFQREAQAAARLVHPNVVQVFDSGQRRDHRPVLHRDGVHRGLLLRGDPARRRLGRGGRARCRSSSRHARAWTTHTATASSTATSSPATCCAPREGEVKLADFGIAKATEQSSITQVGSVLGTAAYLAPEQARGEEAGPSADLYALGVVDLPADLRAPALRGVTRSPSWRSSSSRRTRPTLDTLVAAVTPELADAVAIALALDPRDRYQTRPRDGTRAQRRRARASLQACIPAARGAPADRRPRASLPVTRDPAPRAAPSRAARPRERHAPPASPRAAPPAGARRSRRRRPRRPLAGGGGRSRGSRLLLGLLGLLADRGGDRRGDDHHGTCTDQGDAAQRRLLRRPAGSSALKQLVLENTK